jgi:hypothetical protein
VTVVHANSEARGAAGLIAQRIRNARSWALRRMSSGAVIDHENGAPAQPLYYVQVTAR